MSELSPSPETVHATRPKSKFASWLEAHKGWMTVLGAVIVFLTYVVKEGAKDDAKEARDALENALRDLTSRHDFDGIMEELHPFFVSWQYFEAKVSILPEFKKELDTGLIAENAEHKCSVLLELVKTFPAKESREQRKELEELELTFKNLKNESKKTLEGVRKFTLEKQKTNDYSGYVAIDQLNKNGAHWEKTLTEARPKLDAIEKRAIKIAEREKERYESNYKFWKNASYALYGLGWALGLVGNLAGVKLGGGGE